MMRLVIEWMNSSKIISPCDHRITCLTDVGQFFRFFDNYQLSVGICTSNENDRVTNDDSSTNRIETGIELKFPLNCIF